MRNEAHAEVAGLTTLKNVERRVHWLSMRMVDAANRDRADPAGPKVGGHQA